MAEAWVEDVLDFWFKDLTRQDWFSGGPELDEKVRARFLPLYEKLKSSFSAKSTADARTALAAIIVFDQFPRNMFRGTPAAFATDDLALAISRLSIEKKFDADLDDHAKAFLYMPFMHSEVAADQERCVDLFRSLPNAEESIKYAIEHRDIVAKFGRFPHRNYILGRESTEAEIEFLKTHAGYGQ